MSNSANKEASRKPNPLGVFMPKTLFQEDCTARSFEEA